MYNRKNRRREKKLKKENSRERRKGEKKMTGKSMEIGKETGGR